jgi:hypothetical protein
VTTECLVERLDRHILDDELFPGQDNKLDLGTAGFQVLPCRVLSNLGGQQDGVAESRRAPLPRLLHEEMVDAVLGFHVSLAE